MEEEQIFVVEITPEGEQYFLDLLSYLYETHSEASASQKSEELLNVALSLDKMPYRGSMEPLLNNLRKDYRFLLYNLTGRKKVKVIYFIDDKTKTVFVTDFFPCEMDSSDVNERNKP